MEALLQHSTTKPMTSRVLSAVLPSSTLRTDFLADEGAECGFSLEKISKNHALVTQLFEAAAEAVAADVKLPLDESWAVFSLIKVIYRNPYMSSICESYSIYAYVAVTSPA